MVLLVSLIWSLFYINNRFVFSVFFLIGYRIAIKVLFFEFLIIKEINLMLLFMVLVEMVV